jgi:hypothetical protein
MNHIFSEHSGDLITRGWRRSKRLWIQMMYFGVIYVWGARDGRRLEIIYVRFDKLIECDHGRRIGRIISLDLIY